MTPDNLAVQIVVTLVTIYALITVYLSGYSAGRRKRYEKKESIDA